MELFFAVGEIVDCGSGVCVGSDDGFIDGVGVGYLLGERLCDDIPINRICFKSTLSLYPLF